jgi:hypothetical protein
MSILHGAREDDNRATGCHACDYLVKCSVSMECFTFHLISTRFKFLHYFTNFYVNQGKLYYNAFERHQLQQPDFGKYGYLQSRQQGRDDDHDHDHDQNQTVQKRKLHLFSIDTELVYWNFHKDFGPLNLGQLFRFCTKLNQKLQDPRLRDRVIVLYSNTSFAKRANAMYLLAAWQVLYMRRSPEDACMPFKSAIFDQSTSKQNSPRSVTQQNYERRVALDPIPPFHDASPCPCTYDLNILDCLRGLVKARANNFFNFDTFDITEYEHFEQVEVRIISHDSDWRLLPYVSLCSLTPSLG